MRYVIVLAAALSVAAPSLRAVAAQQDPGTSRLGDLPLPTGRVIDPVRRGAPVGSFPLNAIVAPEGDRIVLSLSGYLQQGLQVVDRSTGRVEQTITQPAAFLGLAFAPDGRTLYSSGGNQDAVYRYDWSAGRATLRDSLVLAPKAPRRSGTRYPAGIAVSPDGRWLFVAENLADSLAVVDVASGAVVQRIATERYPYGVAVAKDGTVYVSAWGGHTVSVIAPGKSGTPPFAERARITVGRHPSALLLNASGTRLFVASGSTDEVAVVDTRARRVSTRLFDPPPSGPHEGSTPNALALAPDESRLFVAEADANAVAVFDLSATTAGVPAARGTDRLIGRIPVEWYPTAVVAGRDTLVVVNAKGAGSASNPRGPQPVPGRDESQVARNYTLGQLWGTLTIAPLVRLTSAQLAPLTDRVRRANHWTDAAGQRAAYPPFKHIIYVIKENRTYDQVLGDVSAGDGDTSLVFFGRAVTPNHHAIAERFGLFDRFLVNAEVSGDGHNWSTAAYATDYVQKTVASNYSKRGRTYDYEGVNRGPEESANAVPRDDVNEPASGYLWDLAQRKGITFRDYGEFVVQEHHRTASGGDSVTYRGNKPFLVGHVHPDFPGFNLDIRDQHRADIWIAELQEFARSGAMPALEILRLPDDHTSGLAGGKPTPRAHVADNDLALGRVVEALSKSPFWSSTVMFVLEDDAQNGPDHVDSHRSPLLVVSPYGKPGVVHRFANTTDVLRTIEDILGLESLSQFDHYGRPLRDIWLTKPDLRPYAALLPQVSLDETNPRRTRAATESARLDLRTEDAADMELFNRILWRAMKGSAPYPGTRRLSPLELKRGE